ncbi:MAG TPA: M20 aminoacylase family protein [Hyphomicrobiaceae bacterium]|nr:M20 aminoacylase family protein [Hyphomicrobiaceae bacterium]
MPIINRVAELQPEVAAWRQDIHENPELLYDVHRTAELVRKKLIEFGCDEVVPGVGRTGVVGVIKGRKSGSGRVVGMRADMDALPIQEITGLPYASKTPGKMHACGHDGHTAMLLGASKYLCETRNFDGTAIVIFQPAEEGGAGGKAMVDDGMMDRWGIQEVYGMHNMPGIPTGHFAIRPGPMLAASDRFDVTIEGRGAHAAKPHQGIDPVAIGCQLHAAFQTIVSRNVDPIDSAVVSMTMFHAGDAMNVIPQTAKLAGTVRTLKQSVREKVMARMRTISEGLAAAYDAKIELKYSLGYPVTVNHVKETAFAANVARQVVGEKAVDDNTPASLGGEDFAYMLEARPGAFIYVGNGDTAGVHHPAYNFNDEAIPSGVSFWAKLAEAAMPAR